MFRHLRSLFLAACLATAPQLFAQVQGAPQTIDYQGRVLDANSLPLANTTPTNFEIKFRIYDAQEGGALIWAERQTVTVDKGNFSVRLGEGQPIPATGGSNEPRPSLADAFNNRDRFLGLTVVITGQPEGEISPRLAFLTSPYAFVAEKARSVDAPAGTTSSLANTTINGTVTVATGNLSVGTGTISGSGSGLTSLNAGNISTGILADARLSANAALLNRNPQTFTGVNSFTSNFGLGQTNPGFPLHLTTASNVTSLYESSSTIGTWLALRNSTASSRFWQLIATGTGNGGGAGNLLITTGSSAAQTENTPMTFTPSGNIGIGTLTPNGRVTIANNNTYNDGLVISGQGANFGVGMSLQNLSTGGRSYVLTSNSANGSVGAGGFGIFDDTVAAYRLTITKDGNVGIGVNAATQARLVVNGTGTDLIGSHAAFGQNGGSGLLPFPTPISVNDVTIKASNGVHALFFRALSDARIKNIQGRSDGKADLELLSRIEVCDYTHKDVVEKGSRAFKKVVAQQVEKVYPQAVANSTDVIPDIYQKATIRDGWVALKTDLKQGERVRLIGAKNEGIHEVLEVAEGKFRTDFTTEGEDVFVYGREVQDFRTVDYEAIAMLNVSATQQIKKEKDAEIKALQEENAGLRTRLSALEAKDRARDAKLSALEKALLPAVRPVSLQLGAK